MRFLILSILLLSAAPAGFTKTIHVPGDYLTIQEAIEAAGHGDTVLVAPGTYKETIDFIGKAITVKSSDGAAATTIDAQQSGCCATFNTYEGANSILEGFTLTNGTGSVIWVTPMGGAVFCGMYSAPKICGNIITGNNAVYGGGIACVNYSSASITGNVITDNKAKSIKAAGGGIYCINTLSNVIEGNIITKNSSELYGGGIVCISFASSLIRYNTFSENTASENGGGIECFDNASPAIQGNIFSGNLAKKNGGGISFDVNCYPLIADNILFNNSAVKVGGGIDFMNSYPLVTNNTLHGNQAGNTGGAMRFGTGSQGEIANTILWNNQAPTGPEIKIGGISTLSIHHSNVYGGKGSVEIQSGSTLNWGSGNIDADPLFVDGANGDYHLTFPSPCKDMGDNSAVTEIHDFEGDPRIAYSTVDMGADEFYTHLYWTGDATPGGNIEVKFIGLPGTSPVGLCLGTGVLDPPLPSMWGDWYLAFPIIGPIGLPPIPADGVYVLPGSIPGTPQPPYSIPMQALVGAELTNYCVLEVQ